MIESSIFKSYDIRGIYPDQLNEHTAFEVGRGFVLHTKAKKIVVGHDARLSSLELFRSLTEAIVSQGADIYNIGLVPTEAVYFALGNYDFDAAIMVTASHNPKEYNGFKMLTKKNGRIDIVRGKDLLSTIEKAHYEEHPHGNMHEKHVIDEYITYVLGFVKNNIKPFVVAIDPSHGVMGQVIEKLKEALPIKVIELNFKPDGNFPNHSPNPLEEGAADQISNAIQQHHADVGVMFDADADRIFLVDEKGGLISSDVTRLILAKYMLSKNPGAAIVYDLISSKAVPEFVKKWGGVPVKEKVGFVNIREALIQHNGVLGSEVSGHYCYRDYWYMDSAMISFLIILQELSREGKKVSDVATELTLYAKAPVVNFEAKDKEGVLEAVKQKYRDGKQDFADGVTVEYKDWWFNLRPSNTEPVVKLTIEADTQDLLLQKKSELSKFIQQ